MSKSISKKKIDEIVSANNIVDLALSLMEMQPVYERGEHVARRHKGKCPFHKDEGQSFHVFGGRQQGYLCYKCQKSGDVISFVMEYENVSRDEAISMLAARGNVSLDLADTSNQIKKEEKA